MEYVPGEDLKRLIRKVGQLSAGKTVFIAKQVFEGLAETHGLGLVHRNIKPQSILIDELRRRIKTNLKISRYLEKC